MKGLCAVFMVLALSACASAPILGEEPQPPGQQPRAGGYYKDDGPGEKPPANLEQIADAQPRAESLHRYANRPYQVFGKEYVPLASVQPFRQRGMASWYGKKFHGQRTASGEPYDMYAMTAAHPMLPIPSYARVTHVATGRSVVVRINDRGPFHQGRIIDLSYAAALKLNFAHIGSALVDVESIAPGETQPASTTPQQESDPAIYVQLGAFSARENAEGLRLRVMNELSSLQDTVQVILSGDLWRLHIGPYRSREDARSVAERIESQLSVKPLLVVR